MLQKLISANGVAAGIGFGLAAMGIFSINDAIWKYLTAQGQPIPFLLFVHMLITTLVCAGLAIWRKTSLKPVSPVFLILYTLLFSGEMTTFLIALTHLPLLSVFIIVLSAPPVTALLAALFLKEHMKPWRYITIGCAFLGVILVILDKDNAMIASNTAVPLYGYLAGFANVLLNSGKILLIRKYGHEVSELTQSFWVGFGLTAMSGLYMLATGIPAIDMRFFGWQFWGGLGSALGLIFYSRAFRMAPAGMIAPTQYSQILWALVLGYAVFAESPGWLSLLGAGCVIGSGAVFYLRQDEKVTQETRPSDHPY